MRLGFIGIGAIARLHAGLARECGAEVICAVASSPESSNWPLFEEQVKPPHCLVRRFETVADLINSQLYDALIVASSWDSIPALLPYILEADCPILTEKPVALREIDARQLTVHPHADNAQVAFNRRFYKPVQELRSRIRSSGLKCVHVVISEHLEHHKRTTGLSVLPFLYEFTSIHTLDLMNYLFGTLRVVHMRSWIEQDNFISYNGLLETESSIPVMLRMNANDPSPVGFSCLFNDGTTWKLSPLERLQVFDGVNIELPTPEWPARRFYPHCEHVCIADMTHKPGFKEQMEWFLSGRPHGNGAMGASLVDAWRALELLKGIRTWEQGNV